MTEPPTAPNDDDARGLVVYASTHGHTAKIAARVAEAMRAAGVAADLHDVASAGDAEPGLYDVVVVGASLHREHHQQEIVDWVSARRESLEHRPAVFFSVSLSAAEHSEHALAATQGCIDEFCAQTGWTPARTERIAGCLQYREYDPFTRQLMRLMMRRMGHPTDASHDYDYTDWDAVDRFGSEIAALAATASPTPIATRRPPEPADPDVREDDVMDARGGLTGAAHRA